MLGVSCVGKPISILDGIFVTIKDDIDCFPHTTKGEYAILTFYLKHFLIQQTCHKVFHDRWNNMAARRSFRGEGFSSCFKTSQLWCNLNWKVQYA